MAVWRELCHLTLSCHGLHTKIVILPRLLQDAVKVMAKSLIRNRHAVTKMYNLKGQLQAVSLRIQVGPLPHKSEVFCMACCHLLSNVRRLVCHFWCVLPGCAIV